MPKLGHFGQKSINFLILTKFCMYPILKVLISNLTFVFENVELKSPNLGILSQKYKLANLNETLPVSYFQGTDVKSDIRFRTF